MNKPSVIIITGGCSAKDLPISCSSSPDILNLINSYMTIAAKGAQEK